MTTTKQIEYQSAIQAVVLCARLLRQHDIRAMLRAIEHADAVGPILNPTLWMRKATAMGEDAEMLRAALPLWQLGGKLAAREAEKETKP